MTGSTDGRPYQLAGTVPAAGRPGLAYLGAVRSTVATTVLPETAPPGTVPRRSRSACLADAVPDGRATAAATPPLTLAPSALTMAALPRLARPLDGPAAEESSSPADTAAATVAIMVAVIAVREARSPRLAGAVLAWPRDKAVPAFASGQLRMVTMPEVSSPARGGR
jgi:hypothetical protein